MKCNQCRVKYAETDGKHAVAQDKKVGMKRTRPRPRTKKAKTAAVKTITNQRG
jgi:hypothetical protein